MSKKKSTMSRRDLLKAGGAAAVVTSTAALLPTSKVEAKNNNKKVSRQAMVIDLRKCIGCRGCTVACKSELNVPLNVWNAVVKQEEVDDGAFAKKVFLPRLCNHCKGTIPQSHGEDYPPCVNACPRKDIGTADWEGVTYHTGASYKRSDGAILYDSSECIACYACIAACPYGARHVDTFVTPGGPSQFGPSGIGKCSFCVHRVDSGVVPSCVNTCLGRARIFGDLNDPTSEVFKLVERYEERGELATLLPEANTLPHVFYIDPDNVLSTYVAGEPFRDKVEY